MSERNQILEYLADLDVGDTIFGIVCFTAGTVVRYALSYFSERSRERRAEVRKVWEEYISKANASGSDSKEVYWRFRTLQQLGAVDLSDTELKKICKRIVSAGFSDPSVWYHSTFDDDLKTVLDVLRWGRLNSVDLGDYVAVANVRLNKIVSRDFTDE
jgi:hypothetical protein